jgi:hypothetical protein
MTATVLRNIQRGMVGVVLMAYPVWYLSPSFKSNSCTLIGSKPTDVGASVVAARMYKSAAWPWSHQNVTAAPLGESPWRWQELSQLNSRTLLWVLSKIFDACAAVNVYMTIGWILTGLSVYLLSRSLGVRPLLGALSGLLTEVHPWWRSRLENHPNYLHYWPLVFLIGALIHHRKNQTRQSRLIVAVALFVSLLFDPYIAWFSVFIVVIYHVTVLLTESGLHSRRSALWSIAALLSLALLVNGTLRIVDWHQVSQRPGYGGRTFGLTSESFIRFFSGSIWDWIKPGEGHPIIPISSSRDLNFAVEYPHYLGLVGLVGVAGFLFGRKYVGVFNTAFLGITTLISFLLTLPPVLSLGPISVPNLSYFLRFLAIGLRHYARIGSLAQIILVVLAGVLAEWLLTSKRSQWFASRHTLISILGVCLFVDLYPAAGRTFYDLSERLEPLEQLVTDSGENSVLVLPLNGFANVVASYTTLNVVNSLFGSRTDRDIDNAASISGIELSRALGRLGVKFVFKARDNPNLGKWNQYPLLYELPSAYFHRVATIELPGAYYGEVVDFDLYRVRAAESQGCHPCGPGPNRTSVEVSGDILSPESGVRWSFGDEVRLSIPKSQGAKAQYWMTVTINTLVESKTLALQVGSARSLVVSTGNRLELDIRVSSEQIVKLLAVDRCLSPNQLGLSDDPRRLCYSISSIVVTPVVPRFLREY